jgi:replicative superfamily II helicase
LKLFYRIFLLLKFCSTRKSTQQAAVTLTQSTNKYVFNAENEQELIFHSANIKDAKLKEFLAKGVGIHHAGLAAEDRKLVETLFLNTKLKILRKLT